MFKKYNNLPKGIKASFWFMVCNFLQKGITFLTIPIFTRIMSADDYGAYSLFLSWQEIVSIFATLNLNYQCFNNGMVKYKDDKDGYATSMIGLGFVSTVVTFISISVFYTYWVQLTNISYEYLIIMSINMFSLLVIGIWTVRKRYEYDYKVLTILTVLLAVLNPVLGIILVKLNDNKIFFRILSIMISSLIFAIICASFLMKKSKKIFVKNYWKYALTLALPLIPHYISMVILHSSDRIMIGKFVSNSATAFYSISYQVALLMQIVINSVNGSFNPWIYQRLENKEYDKIRKVSNLLLVLVAVLSTLPMFVAPEAILILGGKEYLDAADIIPVLSVSVFMIFFYSLFANVELFFEKSKYITYGSLAAAIINILLNYIAIPLLGYKSAAYTTLISYILLAVFHYIMYKKVCKQNDIQYKMFDIKKMILMTLVLIVFSFIITFSFNYYIIRFGIIILLIIMLILNRKKIILLFEDIKNKS